MATHAGGVPVGMVPPADTDSAVAAGVSYVEQCQDSGVSPKSVGLLPVDKDILFDKPEAIVVGAVGTGAPWFLTRWAEGTEVEFMIDTGCQVTILATSVFEQMCAADRRIRDWLRPCNRRLVSAD